MESNFKKNNFFKKTTRCFFLLSFISFTNCFSQTEETTPTPTVAHTPKPSRIGAGIAAYLSGGGHGTFYSIYASLSKGRHFYSLGPVMQQRTNLVQGGRFTYEYLLGSRDDDFSFAEKKDETSISFLQVSLFSYFQYVDYLPLSFRKTQIETQSDQQIPVRDWNKIKFSTMEIGIGAQALLRLTKRLRFKVFCGAAVYYHFNYIDGMYEDRAAPIVTFGTSFSITNFKK